MKICLIGSSRFMDKYLEVNRKLSLAGHTVYSIATRSTSADYSAEAFGEKLLADEKETLDLVHLHKISESDECFVITDETGYVGESTKREIKWAMMHGIDIFAGDHHLNHHLCGKAGIQTGVGAMLTYIKKAAEAGDNGDCREKVSKVGGIFIGFPNVGPAPEVEAN